jgi:hypothetical protein
MNENANTQENQSIENETFINKLNLLPSVEGKIRFCLEEMKKALTKEDKPDFKSFWDIKNECLAFFKESLSSSMRIEFWKEYIELSNEVKQLKNILHEQTIFEVEQIDLAITSIEEELKKYEEVLETIDGIEIDTKLKSIAAMKDFFIKNQKELTFLNALAARITSLRKEVIKTQMRITNKNRFLKRLTLIGDFVYPKRKELIVQISDAFVNLINEFAENTFDLQKIPFYILRDEIKGLQDIAKKITLNTFTFTNCRLKLSKCWDQVKIAEKDYKKEKAQLKDSVDQVLEKINSLKTICENNPEDACIEKEEKEIINLMKTLTLRKEDVSFLKHKIREAKEPIFKKQLKEKEEKIKKENEVENNRKKKLDSIQNAIGSILENSQLSVEELDQEKKQIEKELELINPAKFEKLILEKQFRALSHLIEDKKEKMNLKTSDVLKDLLKIFEQKKQRRVEIKNHLDSLNKELACSGFDFEKAMLYRDIIDSEKKKLEEVNLSVMEIEEKIADLESN